MKKKTWAAMPRPRNSGTLLNDPASLGLDSAGFEPDFAERSFVLRDILLQHVEQRLGLLRAQLDALEVLDVHGFGRRLIGKAEHEQEVPKAGSNLNAVGVVLAVLGQVDDVNFRWFAHVIAFGKNHRSDESGGDDGARTRDLRRDRPAF